MRYFILRSFAAIRNVRRGLLAPAVVAALSVVAACSDPTTPDSQNIGDLPWYWNIAPNAITMAVGDTLTLQTVLARLDSVVSPLGADDTVTWTTSDLRKVSVSNTGLITALGTVDIGSPVKISASITEGSLTRVADAYVFVTQNPADVSTLSLRTSDYHVPVRGFFDAVPFSVPRTYMNSAGDTVSPVLTYFTVTPSGSLGFSDSLLGEFIFFVRGKRFIQAHAYAYGKQLYDSATYTVTGVDVTTVQVRMDNDKLRAYLSNDGGLFGGTTYHNHLYVHLSGVATFLNGTTDTLTGTFDDPTFADSENPGGSTGNFILAPGESTVRRFTKAGIARMVFKVGAKQEVFQFEIE